MTKKLMIPLIVVAAIIVIVLGAFTVMGWDNVIADLNYQYLDNYDEATNTSAVSWYVGRSADISIPGQIYDVKIVRIGNTFAKAHPEIIESVTMDNNIVEIASNAFSYECKNLKRITLSNNLKEIGSNAFANCTALTSINIPSGVTEIKATTFANCTALTSVVLPDTVTSVDATAFSGSENVVVTYKGDTYDYAHIEDLVAAAAA